MRAVIRSLQPEGWCGPNHSTVRSSVPQGQEGLSVSASLAHLAHMPQRTLPAGFIAPCLPTKTEKLPSGDLWLHVRFFGSLTSKATYPRRCCGSGCACALLRGRGRATRRRLVARRQLVSLRLACAYRWRNSTLSAGCCLKAVHPIASSQPPR